MKLTKLLHSLLNIVESAVSESQAQCPECGCDENSIDEVGFDVEMVSFVCGGKYKYTSNFPGIVRIETIEKCKKEGHHES